MSDDFESRGDRAAVRNRDHGVRSRVRASRAKSLRLHAMAPGAVSWTNGWNGRPGVPRR